MNISSIASTETLEHCSAAVLACLGTLLIATCGLTYYLLVDVEVMDQFVIGALIQSAVYATSVWWIARRRLGRSALFVILGVAAVVRAIAFPIPPYLSTDAYRYVWDGRVQATGINPYRYLPEDEALAPLRDEAIYPYINHRASAPTIYPPASQLIFLLATRLFGYSLAAIKIVMIACEVVAIAALVALLRHRGLPTSRVLIYAWHPLPVWELAGTGHVDAAAIAFICLALLAAHRERPALAGAALGAATLVKFFPALLAPALWRRWDLRMPAGFLATIILLYIPYLGAGPKVFGFLAGYGDEEGYRDGSGFYFIALLRALGLPVPSGIFAFAVVIAVVAGIATIIAFRRAPDRLRDSDFIVIGSVALVLVSPHYAWYFAWLVPILCMALYLPLLYATLACVIFYLPRDTLWGSRIIVDSLVYGGFLVIAAADALLKARSKRPMREASHLN